LKFQYLDLIEHLHELIATASSWAYIFDMSPPISGHVYDGNVENAPPYMKDVDYQTDVKTLSSYWEGFQYILQCYNIYAGMLAMQTRKQKSVIITNNIVRFEYLVK
jgi:hypothetical protein